VLIFGVLFTRSSSRKTISPAGTFPLPRLFPDIDSCLMGESSFLLCLGMVPCGKNIYEKEEQMARKKNLNIKSDTIVPSGAQLFSTRHRAPIGTMSVKNMPVPPCDVDKIRPVSVLKGKDLGKSI
jgi:hypothetical protein